MDTTQSGYKDTQVRAHGNGITAQINLLGFFADFVAQ